ncbi:MULTISPECIES: hypothetical protein [Cohnella]|jgi:hypothetical protein|uniref:hypothetical protein n=1 Tax=Cohnella TaxID=329857 RepID=UPI00037B9C64|nr:MULTISPECIES: hypothetical protein [Cohnella]REK68163.1 MAG: hypothetical protein C6P35_02875 [Cohnella sp.]
MVNVTIDLYQDWLRTVREVFRGSGAPLPNEMTDEEVGRAYYLQTSESEEQAEERRAANERRFSEMQRILLENLETVIVPDIRKRTGYEGERFHFRWVYMQGENIIEEFSEYWIPLGPSPD